MPVRVGDRVRVRQQSWTVSDVTAFEACSLVTLTRRETSGERLVRRVIHPFDDVEAVPVARAPRHVSLRRWRHLCRQVIAQDGDASALRTAAAARIDLLPYQLEPALALLGGLGTRVLIADEVGLGKTVQAMLAVAELLVRGVATRVLVVCPAGLREQWAGEWSARFSLSFAVIDHAGLRRARARLPSGVNPWSAESLVITSSDYVKRHEVLPSVLATPWDIVVIDEAHTCSGMSDRREAVGRLCEQALYVLLLTATPHSGDEAAFSSLSTIGRHDDDLVVFRRTRLEVGRDAGRRAHVVRVAMTAAERRMHLALAALTRAVRRQAAVMDRHAWLMLSLFHKRALSSPFALAESVGRRLAALGSHAGPHSDQLMLPLDDEAGELDASDLPPMWSAPALHDAGRERRLLEHLAEAARAAEGFDGKLQRLRRLLGRLREPAIVFTEYRDTLLHLRRQVAPDAAIIHGGLTREQRRAALDRFPAAGVLLATDAAGEGLNLQQHCRVVINLELPWNPVRLEQRIGRVDRIGQRSSVHVFNLIASGTGETRLVERLSARIATARARVGAADPLTGRPSWTEDQSARVVVMRQDGNDSAIRPAAAPPAVPLTQLVAEREREANRVAMIRRLDRASRNDGCPDDAVEPPALPAIARTRRRQSRAWLRGRTLAILQSLILDGDGRTIASRVSAVLVPDSEPESTAFDVTRLVDSPSSLADRGWREAVLHLHRRVIDVQLRRARTIATLGEGKPAPQQVGLFDRRVEHEMRDRERAHADAGAAALARVARVEAASRVVDCGPRTVLVLLPCRVARP